MSARLRSTSVTTEQGRASAAHRTPAIGVVFRMIPDDATRRSTAVSDSYEFATHTFSNLKENEGITDKEFVFRIPRGVDVITDGTGN